MNSLILIILFVSTIACLTQTLDVKRNFMWTPTIKREKRFKMAAAKVAKLFGKYVLPNLDKVLRSNGARILKEAFKSGLKTYSGRKDKNFIHRPQTSWKSILYI